MKAISIQQPWASMIASGEKTIETRVWSIGYRGELLICSSKRPVIKPIDRYPIGKALCIARLVECRMMTERDQFAACCKIYAGAFAWVLTDIRPVEPFDVRGKLRLFEVEDDRVLAGIECENCNGISTGCEVDGMCVQSSALNGKEPTSSPRKE